MTSTARATTLQTIADRRIALFARTSTPALVGAARILEAVARPSEEERMTLAWTCDELARRGGGISDDEGFDALLDAGMSYLDALLVVCPVLSEA